MYEKDAEVYAALEGEAKRQSDSIVLIASESIASRAVREAQASVLTNKYAEGYPAQRWYEGCRYADEVEELAIERAKQLFGAEHANVQPHCGSSANMGVYFSIMNPGDTMLTMKLSDGGHLTHGHPINFSGRLFNVVSYGVSKKSEQIDYDEMAELAEKHRPKLIVVGCSSYSRIIDFKRVRKIADATGAYVMADIAHIAGLVVAGCHPSPVPHCDFVTGTTHKTLCGPRGGFILCRKRFAADIDRQIFPGIQGGPLMHVVAAKAVCFYEAVRPAFKKYMQQIVRNSQALANALAEDGLRIVSGGTDNHLALIDLSSLSISGRDAASALQKARIVLNKNAIPFDKRGPGDPSGIRVGTPTVTARGMSEQEMKVIGGCICEILDHPDNESVRKGVRAQVADLVEQFPIP
jgi:glycine hydroxymethyltransferase